MKEGNLTGLVTAIGVSLTFVIIIPIAYFLGSYDKIKALTTNTFYDNWGL